LRSSISRRSGCAIAMGVPALVLVSVGPVAAFAGPPSILAWAITGAIGLVMVLAFAELVGAFDRETGGISVAAARALRPHSPFVALLGQWSYWFGWTLALAITGALVGNYLRRAAFPDAPEWSAWLLAVGVLFACLVLNRYGIRISSWVQVLLAGTIMAALAAVLVVPLVAGEIDLGRLAPFEPPGGWTSWQGVSAIGGALFLAGWSSYGAEVALSWRAEYRNGTRAATSAAVAIGIIGLATFTIVPFVLVAALGPEQVRNAPETALVPLAQNVTDEAATVVLGVLLVSLLLAMNMIAISSSRLLWQMGRNGDAWAAFGRLNRHGVPETALRFDFAFNVCVLTLSLAINGSRIAEVPVALLASANIGYFLSIIIALVAAWTLRRAQPQGARLFRAPRGVIGATLPLAVLNAALLGFSGTAWGWQNAGLGALAIVLALVLFTPRAATRLRSTQARYEPAVSEAE
jgi:amino acid transporter